MSLRRQLTLFYVFLAVVTFLAGAFSLGRAAEKPDTKGTVVGRIMMKEGGPLEGGEIMFYSVVSGPPPTPEKYDRTPDYVREIAPDGRFEADLPAGKYYASAVKRTSRQPIGPPQAGDLVWRGLDEKGNHNVYEVKAGERTDIGTIAGAAVLKAESITNRPVATAIEGIVVNMEGKPVSDAVVVAFLNPNVQSKPLFVSEKTGDDGKYVLRLTAGTYYLRVRNRFASGPPEPGQIVGYYGEGTPAAVTIKDGETLKGIDFKVILFPGRGPFSGSGR